MLFTASAFGPGQPAAPVEPAATRPVGVMLASQLLGQRSGPRATAAKA